MASDGLNIKELVCMFAKKHYVNHSASVRKLTIDKESLFYNTKQEILLRVIIVIIVIIIVIISIIIFL